MSEHIWFDLVKSVGIPLFAAWYGASIGGKNALEAGTCAHANNVALEKLRADRQIDGILAAIHYELGVMRGLFSEQGGRELKQLADGKPLEWYFSIEEDYFIVYPNNTEIVGQINDPELCRSIVVTYCKASVFIDSLKINNWYVGLQQKARDSFAETFASESTDKRLALEMVVKFNGNLPKIMAEHATKLKVAYSDLENDISRLLTKIQEYRNFRPLK